MQEIIETALLGMVLILSIGILFFQHTRSGMLNAKQKRLLKRILLASALLLILQLLGEESFESIGPIGWWIRLLLYLFDYVIIGSDILKKAANGILNRNIVNENFLMTVATLGAWILAILQKGAYLESIAVLLFYQIGEWFESYAVGRSRRNIRSLMDIRPDSAHLEENGTLRTVHPDQVEVGSTIVVQPGEKVPIDGIVLEGSSTLNTTALTGESLPRDVGAGSKILSGSINLTGLLHIRTNRVFGESTASKILELVESASSHKSHSETLVSRFARIYTPAVCLSALALACIPPLIQLFLSSPTWETWIYRALSFLVASCPCALVISVPLAFFAGIGGASQAGILIKGSHYLEALAQVQSIVFDKTGTLTQGVFEVNSIHHNNIEQAQLIEWATLAESASSHPISRSLQAAYGKPIDRSRVQNIQEYSGKGVIAQVDAIEIAVGNEKLMLSLDIDPIPCRSIGTILHIAVNRKYAGHILISDRIKPTSTQAIHTLQAIGIRKISLLTGDNPIVANQVAEFLNIPSVHANLLPQDKVRIVETLLEEQTRRQCLAFVGDGINDAPVLRRADIGIAMGALGSDAAIEAADVVLMHDDPLQIPKALKIARKCLRIVYQNITMILAVKLICLFFIALGLANMWLAVFSDVGVLMMAILNSVRALRVSKL